MSNLAQDLSLVAANIKRLHKAELNLAFNPERLDLKPTAAQMEILKDSESLVIHVLGGNRSGKTAIGARIVSWWFNNSHPYMARPAEWGKGPITIMVIGRVLSQVEFEIFEKKIRPFLEPGSYDIDSAGGALQRIVHKENGNQIMFFSHHAINIAREKVQAHTVQVVWCDEMADSASFIAELQTRLITSRGRLLCTFTPLVRSEEVRQLVDGAKPPLSRKYQLMMLDNPLLQDPERQKEILELFVNMSEAERQTRLTGAWFEGDNAVYSFDPEVHVAAPPHYSTTWRHVASVDPAMSTKTGYTLWAEDPNYGVWYCIEASYFRKILNPVALVEMIENRLKDLNIVRRISDTEPWFITTAASPPFRVSYVAIYKKRERKKELIKALQAALSNGRIKIAPTCTELISEFQRNQWDPENPDKMISASRFHHLDTCQYFVDNMPKFVPLSMPTSTLEAWEAQLKAAHKKRLAKEAAQKKAKMKLRRGRRW